MLTGFILPSWAALPVHLSRMHLRWCPGDPTCLLQHLAACALGALRPAWPLEGQSVRGGAAVTAHSCVTVDGSTWAEGCRGKNTVWTVLPTDIGINSPAGTSMDAQVCAGHRGQEGCDSTAGHGDEPRRRLQPGCEAAAGPGHGWADVRVPGHRAPSTAANGKGMRSDQQL